MEKNGAKNFGFWDFLIWLGITLLLSWTILKAFGVIHSPIWTEMIP